MMYRLIMRGRSESSAAHFFAFSKIIAVVIRAGYR